MAAGRAARRGLARRMAAAARLLRLAGGAAGTAAELAAGLRVFPDRMRDNLRDELLSEHVAAELSKRSPSAEGGDPRERVAEALREGRPLSDLVPGIDPADVVGCAPELVDRALDAYPRKVTG